ncbi:MAG: MerR family transcriptional regulator [Betaproteobacteria bacterium]|nr:MerR family transcriptional regulator [Betaproteobacteria bacterium]
MNLRDDNTSQLQFSIAAVERDTGIGKDTLRVWERRYGFPQPGRDNFDERSYPLAQVEKLRIIKRLLDAGHRPGQVVALPVEELQRLTESLIAAPLNLARSKEGVGSLLDQAMGLLRSHDIDGLRGHLHQAVASMGVNRFVTELLAPLNAMVGDAWMRAEIQVFEEHLYTECATGVLRQAIHQLNGHAQQRQPRVLLTTFPQEEHAVGLLMAESILMLQGCHCLPMGVKTPLSDIAKAVEVHQPDIVALSFSVSQNPNHVLDGLAELRRLLPDNVEIWAGGRAPVLQRRPPPGVTVIADLAQIEAQVQRWRQRGT